MSLRYKGGRISATPPTTTGGESGVASGAWTLEQQLQAQGAGNWPLPPQPKYIEDVFSTWLYTGNNGTQTITNGIDLAGKGGLVWIKPRNAIDYHLLEDTVRGPNLALVTNTTAAQATFANSVTGFTSSGFTLGNSTLSNASAYNLASWTFRKAPKFFDVQTATSSSTTTGVTINHNLGVVPGCVIIKRTDGVGDWFVYHTSLGSNTYLNLNSTASAATSTGFFSVTSTSIYMDVWASASYVAYFYASNAGGFGLTGTDNVISCGSYYNSGTAPVNVNLGYEPQWILIKNADNAQNWFLMDTMRGDSLTAQSFLKPNTSDAETVNASTPGYPAPTATGFTTYLGLEGTYIYIAIRRGPMKVPTDATKVFSPVAYTGTGATRTITASFPVDLAIPKSRGATGNSAEWYTRLIGPGVALLSAYTFQELARPTELTSFASNTGVVLGTSSDSGGANASGSTYVDWNFGRAPSFFDEVCYTGTGVAGLAITHNLGVTPEFVIIKSRSIAATSWRVWQTYLNSPQPSQTSMVLNSTAAAANSNYIFYNGTGALSSTQFGGLGPYNDTNIAGATYVAYLFATCPGVSKVGSYTGTGATQTINCGFTGGARFVLIKRTDSTGDWYVWDTARGMVSGTDPSLLLNSTAAEVNANSIYTATTGFQIVSTAAGINASGGTYIFLAIA